jgi:hypothetical protein
MPGRTIILQQPQQLAEPIGPANWRKLLGLPCFVACWLAAVVAGCPVLPVVCQVRSLLACGASISCGGCTSGMFSCPLVFAWVRYPWEESFSIPHPSFGISCSTCLSGSFACWMTAVGSLASADFGSGFGRLVPFVLA